MDGVGTLRLLDAIRTCGMEKHVKFYQVLLVCKSEINQRTDHCYLSLMFESRKVYRYEACLDNRLGGVILYTYSLFTEILAYKHAKINIGNRSPGYMYVYVCMYVRMYTCKLYKQSKYYHASVRVFCSTRLRWHFEFAGSALLSLQVSFAISLVIYMHALFALVGQF